MEWPQSIYKTYFCRCLAISLKPICEYKISGGAFAEIVNAYSNENYVIFGAEADGLEVFHGYITDKRNLGRFGKSKYP